MQAGDLSGLCNLMFLGESYIPNYVVLEIDWVIRYDGTGLKLFLGHLDIKRWNSFWVGRQDSPHAKQVSTPTKGALWPPYLTVLWKRLRVSLLSDIGVSLSGVVWPWASFMGILFFPPIFMLKTFSGFAFGPVVQMFSSLHSFENNGLFAGHWLSLLKRNNPYPWKRKRKRMPLLLCHLFSHTAPKVKGVSLSPPQMSLLIAFKYWPP